MLEKHGNHFDIELTLQPVEAGIEFLCHNRKLKMPFRVVLMGATTKYGHGIEEPRNVRLLGRFLISGTTQHRLIGSVEAMEELAEYRWEVVFNPNHQGNDSVGFVTKLDSPLPKDWTL